MMTATAIEKSTKSSSLGFEAALTSVTAEDGVGDGDILLSSRPITHLNHSNIATRLHYRYYLYVDVAVS